MGQEYNGKSVSCTYTPSILHGALMGAGSSVWPTKSY